MARPLLWADPGYANSQVLLDLTAKYPSTAIQVLCNRTLTEEELRVVLPRCHWTAGETEDYAHALMDELSTELQVDVVLSAARQSPAAAARLIPNLTVPAARALWHRSHTTRFPGAARVRDVLTELIGSNHWSFYAEDPEFLPWVEELWTWAEERKADWINRGVLAAMYATGAHSDTEHERLIEMFARWTNKFNCGDPANHVLVSTYDTPERVLWWAERSELGAFFAACDPRLNRTQIDQLTRPNTPELREEFGRALQRHPAAGEDVQRAELLTEITELLSQRDQERSLQLRYWADRATHFLAGDEGVDRLRIALNKELPEALLLAVDTAVTGQEHDYVWRLRYKALPQSVCDRHPELVERLVQIRHDNERFRARNTPEPERTLLTGNVAAQESHAGAVSFLNAEPDRYGLSRMFPIIEFIQDHLTTADQLYEFARGQGIAPKATVSEAICAVVDRNPHAVEQDPQDYADVFGNALGDL